MGHITNSFFRNGAPHKGQSLARYAGAHPANFKGGSKKILDPALGVDPENFGGGMKF